MRSTDKIRILIADDDEGIRATLLKFLKDRDYDILMARDGEMAVEVASSEKPDLIVMDWQMPKLSGIEAVRLLAKETHTKYIPVIVITGIMTETESLEQALESGAVDFLRKPLDQREFYARLKTSLRIKQQNDALLELIKLEKKLLEENLETRKRQLASKTLLDQQRDEQLQKLLKQVGRLDRITNHVFATDIRQIERELKNQLNMEHSWNDFKRHFDEVNPVFFDQLLTRFGMLTQNDCKLCAYIKMGLRNTEIANFTYVARESVDRSLNRLKKKLQLSDRQNLRDYILHL